MRFKMWPRPPADLDAVAAAQRAVPLVPGNEDDCCARLMDRRGFPSRDAARTWLTFLRALELAEETPSGYRRTRVDPDPETLAAALRANVFGVEPALGALAAAGGPLSAPTVFERLRDRIPEWERHKRPREWADRWTQKTEWLLGWCALVGLVDATDEGYALAEGVAVDDAAESE